MKQKPVKHKAPFQVPEHIRSATDVEHFYKYKFVDDRDDKYLSRSRRIFTDNELHFSTVADFNDPFDCRFRLALGTSQEERIAYSKRMIEKHEPGLNRQGRKAKAKQDAQTFSDPAFKTNTERGLRERIESWGVCCFSEIGDDILMWSHYANAHQGFCLQFSNELSVPDLKVTRRRIVPLTVKYSRDYPIGDPVSEKRENLVVPLITKAAQWKYEQEWRMINPSGPGLYPFPPQCLTGVIFGLLMPEKHKKMIRDWCKDRHPAIQFYEAQQSKNSYSLKIVKIS